MCIKVQKLLNVHFYAGSKKKITEKRNRTQIAIVCWIFSILFFLGKKSITLWSCFGIERRFGGFYAMDRSLTLGDTEFTYS